MRLSEAQKASARSTATELAQLSTLALSAGALLAASETFVGGEGIGGALVAGHALGWMADGASRLAAEPGPGLRVVVTGATRGLGKSLAREFALRGDDLVVAGRGGKALAEAVGEFRLAAKNAGFPETRVVGVRCDVSRASDVQRLKAAAEAALGGCDVWLNNAGYNPGNKPMMECSASELAGVAGTNLLGPMLCTRAAVELMRDQKGPGGHVFNMAGRGGDGFASPGTAAYGASKAGLQQLQRSLVQELDASGLGDRCGLHLVSPGMVLTDLLLDGTTPAMRAMFNVVSEQPETVAKDLVPRMRVAGGASSTISFLTPWRIGLAIVSAWARRGRYFDSEGRAVYKSEADRLRLWERRQARALRNNFGGRLVGLFAVDALPAPAWTWLFATSSASCYLALQGQEARVTAVIADIGQAIGQLATSVAS